ncbi:MAG: ABC transporter substrate-binding protein [Halanaerobiales bacterium]|nr:ABC transporter substrate-binding protein [Halanaerobiales bacterium]
MKLLKRTSLLLVLTLVLTLTLSFGGIINAAPRKITIQTPPVPAALPLLRMANSGELDNFMDLNVNISPDHQRAISLIAKNDIEFMVTGVNVGAKIYNKGIGVNLVNVNIWGIDYLLTNGFKADDFSDLKGKTLSLPLKGGPLDFLARYLLKENGLSTEDVELVYRPLPNGAKIFMSGQVDSIILPEPLVTTTLAKSDNTYLSLDIQKEWGKLHNGDQRIPFVGLFVSSQFVKEHSGLVDIIAGKYIEGVKYYNENPNEAINDASEYFGIPKPVMEKAWSRVNLNIYPDKESRALTNTYFEHILEMYPEMIGGNLPDEEFYY